MQKDIQRVWVMYAGGWNETIEMNDVRVASVYLIQKILSPSSYTPWRHRTSDVGLKANDDTKLTRAESFNRIATLRTQLYIIFCWCRNRKIEIRWRNKNRRE